MDPLVYGDYPFVMKSLVRNALPKFSEEEKELVKGANDFIGVNYYTSRYASTLPIDADDSPQSHDQYQYVDLKGTCSTTIYIEDYYGCFLLHRRRDR